jgi:hypothetical protein
MTDFAGQMRMKQSAAGASRLGSCARYRTTLVWQLADAASADKAITVFGDLPATAAHRHRRPWGTS